MMHYFYHDGFGYGLGWLFQLVWFLIVIGLAFAFFRLLAGRWRDGRDWGPGGPSVPPKTPLDILKERYAKGEITKKEFEDMKKDLGS